VSDTLIEVQTQQNVQLSTTTGAAARDLNGMMLALSMCGMLMC